MRRVVVTGLGVLSPVGNSVDTFFSSLVNGQSGIRRITKFDPSNLKTQIAGELKDFNPEPALDAREARRMDLFSQYGVVASAQAMEDSGISLESIDPFHAGVILGSGIGGINVLEQQVETYLTKGPGRVSPFYITGMITNIVTGHIAMKFGFMGPNYVTTSACASGCHAIGDAFHAILRGEADVILAGGTEGAITGTSLAGFINIQALSRRNDEPERASRPFDRDRDGFVMGEGAGIAVLEDLEHATKRGAKIYAELVGCGFTADAYHVTAPDPEGRGAAKAMELAIEHAGANREDVDYINCHGTSTPTGDTAETIAIKRAFGDFSKKLNVSSTKSMTGHLLGAAGAIEFVATVLAVQNGVIPPTINYETPDPECDLNYTPNTAVEKEIEFAISNSFGFGGQNATLAVRKFRG